MNLKYSENFTLTEGKKEITVENFYYKATIRPNSGARIVSLVSKKTGNEFAGAFGIDQILGVGKYVYKILEQSKDILKIPKSCVRKT